MKAKVKPGSLQLFLLVLLGMTAVFSVAAFASNENPVERPISYVACQINRDNPVCVPHPSPSFKPVPTPTPNLSAPRKY